MEKTSKIALHAGRAGSGVWGFGAVVCHVGESVGNALVQKLVAGDADFGGLVVDEIQGVGGQTDGNVFFFVVFGHKFRHTSGPPDTIVLACVS